MTVRTGMVAVMHYFGMKPSAETITVDGKDVKIEGFTSAWKKFTQQDKDDLRFGIGTFDDQTHLASGPLTYGDD